MAKGIVTVQAIQQNEITQVFVLQWSIILTLLLLKRNSKLHFLQIATQYWAPYSKDHLVFDPAIVDRIYAEHIFENGAFAARKIVMLEFSQYLERYLWPNYSKSVNVNYLMSVIVMINEKFRERILAWRCICERPKEFGHFFHSVLKLAAGDTNDKLSTMEQSAVITFLVNCSNSIVSFLIYFNFQSQREDLFTQYPKLRKYWKNIEKKLVKMSDEEKQMFEFERCFVWKILGKFKQKLNDIEDENKEVEMDDIHYLERCLEWFIDLEALLTTRRFFNALLRSSNLIAHCTLSSLITSEVGSLFCQLVTMLRFYQRFEIDDITGEALSASEVEKRHYEHMKKLQKAAFRLFRNSMREFYLLNVSAVDSRKALTKQLESMNIVRMILFYWNIFQVFRCERNINQLQQLNEQPLYPTEKVIWDENLVPYDEYSGEGVLALNKLNLQFLTFHDYLLRNFNLFQMESTYEIRQDIEDAVFRMKPWAHETNPRDIVWGGWARMATPLHSFQIVEVGKPLLGEKSPSVVKADVSITLSRRNDLRTEWESLKKHDVCFLLTVRSEAPVGTKFNPRKPFKEQIKIAYVRGCEVEGMLDATGNVIEEYEAYEKKPQIEGDVRTYRVWLDQNQYRMDMDDVYYTFNLLIRRDPKTNNFKAVLYTIRQLLNTEFVVPDWLHDLILGYGDPAAANYKSLSNSVPTMDFCDTFLSYKHLVASFPNNKIITACDDDEKLQPPFRLTFKELEPQHGANSDEKENSIIVEPYTVPSRGPYPHVEPRKNVILFTPAQIEAIKSGMQPGLTMVVGPPGTGKTDVAVQIISNIYHNWPDQRTLVVTHSNQALNLLFEKVIALDVDERHLLRMGHGEETLETEKDFSRYGRVNYVLKKRLELLKEVEKLQISLDVQGDVAYTCETAGHFFLYQVFARWEKFESDINGLTAEEKLTAEPISKYFPFHKYFEDAPQPLFKGVSFEEDWEVAQGCWRYIRSIFSQLEEFRSFELLRSGRDRAEYLLVNEAKIIAMTCTHAALRRKDLVELSFRYDNIIMEEAAQILEVETFIPLLLQNPQDGRSRLKRWIMIGDHHQLPPVVQNMAFQKYSNMEQSLFSRLVRLGVPYVQLDRQGRARAELAALYKWRYKNLDNLPHIESLEQFQLINPGFMFNYQLIDVPDFNGIGEATPSPYFYQNLGEAEYAVALYTYMRILGYPAEKISILTTYNGQASLLRDVVEKRCADNPLIGSPHKISTVDKYQGQQNDYVILSLVRTKNIGHIRDVRRLVVAFSRARLGLYILARTHLYRNCFELTPAFQKLCLHPRKLLIVPNETYPAKRRVNPPPMEPIEIQNTTHMSNFVHQLYLSNMEQMKQNYKIHMKDYFDEKGVPEPMETDSEETKITFESMDFERQDPETLGK
uniref:Intron-binding protein aquarius n=1 Tax=Syphacia muris TaxID=451379 RepID=A0A158R470_9BILA